MCTCRTFIRPPKVRGVSAIRLDLRLASFLSFNILSRDSHPADIMVVFAQVLRIDGGHASGEFGNGPVVRSSSSYSYSSPFILNSNLSIATGGVSNPDHGGGEKTRLNHRPQERLFSHG